MMNRRIAPSHLVFLAFVLGVFVWSSIRPFDRLTWWLEVTPTIVGLIILLFTYDRFRFTTICYALMAWHMALLCVGGHYTYARVPFFLWLEPILGWHRNHFDRLGHFTQGFVPAIIAREVLIRLRVINRRGWLPFLVISICLAISAAYELVEWATALVSGSASTEFLGTQGDIWDTQQDMFLAFIGATTAIILLSSLHNRAIARMGSADRQ